MQKMADERKKNLTSPIARWIDANRETAGFTESLRKLLMYACVEWIRRGTSALLTPEEALSKIVCCGLSEFPVGEWAENPEKYTDEIADFCEKAKILPLPAALQGEIPSLLDLRGVKCPLNSVRSRIVMSGYPAGRTLKIWLDEGSPIENVPGSLIADGHKVLSREKKGNYWEISVVKSDSKV
jgi:TusA-related sulfurtransferase